MGVNDLSCAGPKAGFYGEAVNKSQSGSVGAQVYHNAALQVGLMSQCDGRLKGHQTHLFAVLFTFGKDETLEGE